MDTEQDHDSIVRSVIHLAHNLKLKVVAEGIETEEVRKLLIAYGCDELQGYLFGKPVPASEFEAHFSLEKRGGI
jgi:EAL domain-containing protein (putative c-di-GMP-specific phosphodiesterase class I)